MGEKTVFISYSHDSDEHRERVLALSERLRQDGIDTHLDQYENGSPPQGWPRWMLDQLDAADFVLVVCTETYYRRFRGHEAPKKGKGVDWEGALITQEIYDSRSQTLKFVPISLSDVGKDWKPEPLRGVTHYSLSSEQEYRRLYDFLLGQAGVEPGPLGAPKHKPRRQGKALTFDESSPSVLKKVDISRIVKYAPADLIGREAEIKLLNDTWAKTQNHEPKRPHVLTIVGLGGEGKTSLVSKWAAELAHQDWPGCDAAFAWSFYSQGTRDQATASSDVFLKEALIFFGDPVMAASAAGAYEEGRRLAQLVGEQRALLILDGLEPLQYPPTSPLAGQLKDSGLAALLKGLAATSLGLCVVTSRYGIPDLRAFIGKTVREEKLSRLSREAGVKLLKSFEVKGSLRKNIPSADGRGLLNEFEKLVEDVQGHALTLNLLGSYLRDAHFGDIRKRDLIRLEEADAEEQGGHAFRVMDAYVLSFESDGKKGKRALAYLRLLGLFDRPASADCIAALQRSPFITGLTETLVATSEATRNFALTHLENAKLLTINHDAAGTLISLDAHPLLREYFAQQLRKNNPEAWRAAHQRLYKHLCATTKEGDQPTLEDLQPLYQAVAHGCQAGLQQEVCDKVYRSRILRGTKIGGFYSMNKLGACGSDLGAIACFFENRWSRVSPALTVSDQAWLMNEAAARLRALGRLTEAREPMLAATEWAAEQEEWEFASIGTSNLGDLDLTLGEVAKAVRDAEQSVTYADRSGDAFQRLKQRAKYADTLHQAGRQAEAKGRFHKAEQLQAERQLAFPLLYSLPGFLYCDLLLSETEREAGKAYGVRQKAKLLAVCNAVSERGAKMFEWRTLSDPLLDIGLDYLTLGRAALYAFVLDPSSIENRQSAIENIQAAVTGLRRAGRQDYLPRGLLTRAWLCSLTGSHTGPESAQSDLDEAWEIAERGPMPLFQADIHLYRARLFYREAKYPWDSPQTDLDEARRLIEKHGYWRRKEELEDAEEAVETWKGPGAAIAAPTQNTHEVSVNPEPIHPTIVLVTVNDNETHALLDTFLGVGMAPSHVTNSGVTYNDLGVHGGHRIVNTISEMGAGGVGASQQRARQAIDHWQPRAIIAVGIAFGLDETKQQIGEVLVSTQIQDYELGRLNADGTLTPRGDKPSSADILRNRLRQTDMSEQRRHADWPKVRFGLVLSGQKLVDNLDYRESLKALFTEAIGGEMEGIGLYASAQEAKVDWIVVKGICDWGYNKNNAGKTSWQQLAAKNAARVLKAALDVDSLYSSSRVPSAGATGVHSSPPANPDAIPTGSDALKIWRKKLDFLLTEEAKTSDAEQKFSIQQRIEEVRKKIQEFGGQSH